MHQLAFKAYGEVTSRTASDQQIEYVLFREITHSLQNADGPDAEPAEWADAIHRNLELWTLLSVDMLSSRNQLDPALKANLISLAESVRRISYSVLGERADISELVTINETIMEGLEAQKGKAA